MDRNYYAKKKLCSDAVTGYVGLIKSQLNVSWKEITFFCPILGKRENWKLVVKRTIIEFDRKLKIRKMNHLNRKTFIRRLFAMGGNPLTNTPNHVQGVIEGFGIDDTVFKDLLQAVFVRQVKRFFREKRIDMQLDSSTRVHVSTLYGDVKRYIDYILRPENPIFGYSVDKILLNAINLPPAYVSDVGKQEVVSSIDAFLLHRVELPKQAQSQHP